MATVCQREKFAKCASHRLCEGNEPIKSVYHRLCFQKKMIIRRGERTFKELENSVNRVISDFNLTY